MVNSTKQDKTVKLLQKGRQVLRCTEINNPTDKYKTPEARAFVKQCYKHQQYFCSPISFFNSRDDTSEASDHEKTAETTR